jgi:hypothetical protein
MVGPMIAERLAGGLRFVWRMISAAQKVSAGPGGTKFVLLYLHHGRLQCRPDDIPIDHQLQAS